MATNIVVKGLPGDIKFQLLLNKFRALFRKIEMRNFWIRDATEMEDSQQLTIELSTAADATKAREFLNSQYIRYQNIEYPLEVFFESGARNKEFMKVSRATKRNRPRSRSPAYSSEASKLDMEIELLRKQRQVIEEERRLLVEQKKLEMIREYGPSAAREFDHFDDYEDEPPRKRRQLETVSKQPRPRSPPVAKIPRMHKSARPKGLPVFFQPCKKLIGQMKPHIEKGTTPEEVEILIKLIRAAIRKELAITLEGQAFIPTVEIVKLYREKHPKEQDEAFVAKILANIRTSYLTTDINVKIKKEKVSDNETDDKKGNGNASTDKATDNDKTEGKGNDTKDKETDDKGNEIGEKVADIETAPTDAANADNDADAAVPVDVKTEQNTSQELENISEEVNAEIKNDDTSVPNETAGDTAKDEGCVEDRNTEETKVQ